MDILENVRMAVATLASNKLRSSLTMLGVIIGNASVIALVGIGQGAQNYTLDKINSFGPNRLFIFTGGGDIDGFRVQEQTLVLADAEAIAEQAPAVQAVAPEISSNSVMIYKSRKTNTNIVGTTSEYLYVRNLVVTQGRFLNKSEQQQNAQVVVLGPDLATKLFERENPLGREVQINNLSFQVVGVLEGKGSFLGQNEDEQAYIPITTMADQIAGRRSAYGVPIDLVQVSARDLPSVRAAAFQITNILTQRHGKKDFSVVSNKSFQTLVGQVTGVLSLTLAAIASISLLVGGIGIMNIMLVSVTERTQEIGLRKAIGATQKAILTQFLVEAVILSVTGGLIGTGLGLGGSFLVATFTPLKPSVPISAIVLAVGVSGGIGLFFGVLPARRAAKLDPIVALRSA
ncbi:ABC transporter permease [Leptolyngbya sp. FACHB-261]|uniref:ABC transporter permease n=1 Tax=Leptolyngbya sp. FACHB-261 TaxID=2692806 RepID=UPI0016882F70|nr:ABC transporter permease [Leptolyngbya sp. FACHB-261]MBD2103439.1 ABC transporter permease [Leptolyngbya sp. FACHB-261]